MQPPGRWMRLILGINLEADRATVARAEAEAFMNGIGRSLIMGFELGNEPEVYGRLGWYTTQAGIRVPGRPARYDLGSYLIDYAATVRRCRVTCRSSAPRPARRAG
ncbi:MAG: hypothetical protein WCD11_23220 [Solirubrobacteraceae bacterium]